jgi:hypothetical protein
MQTHTKTKVGQDKPMAVSHLHEPPGSTKDFNGHQVNLSDTTAHLKEWLRSHLKDMQALLDNLYNSAWAYMRTKWGPEWLVNLVNDKHFTRSSMNDEDFDEHLSPDSSWWFWAREGPPREPERKTTCLSKRGSERPNRLRNPRSHQTRELCLLNRLRVHLNDRVLLAVGNKEEVWGATVDGVPKTTGSYEIQNQRWARTLPREPSCYSTRFKSKQTTSVAPRRQELRHW